MTRPYPLILAALTLSLSASYAQTLYPINVPNAGFEVDRDDFPDGLAEGSDVYMKPRDQSWYQFDALQNGGPQRYWNPGEPVTQPESIGKARFADTGFGGIAPEGDHVGISITRYNDNKYPDGTSLPSTNINPATGEVYPETYVRDFEALCQVLEDVLFDPYETYELTVDVGHPPGDPGDPLADPVIEADPDHGSKVYYYNGYMVQLLAGGEEVNEGSSYAPTVYKANGGTVLVEDNDSVVIAANEFQTITITYTPADPVPTEVLALEGLPLQIRLAAKEGPDHSVQSIVAFDKIILNGPPPAPEVAVTPPGPGDTDYVLQWNSLPERKYDVLASSDLTADDWTPIAVDIATTPPTNTVAVPPNGADRFYRIDDKPL